MGQEAREPRTVLVTGGTRGIGRMIAQGFAADGYSVILCARNAADCEREATAIARETSGSCLGIACDLTDRANVERLAAAVAARHPTVHTLINNAGVVRAAAIDSYSEADWDAVFDTDLKAAFFLTQRMLPALRRAATPDWPASIINIGSIGGLRVGPVDNYAYIAAKAGLHHLTRFMAKRLGPENITVNAIAPGPFPSDMLSGTVDAEAQKRHMQEVPLRRFGQARDIAGLAGFLASSSASFITGTVIPLDGGLSA